MRIEGFIGGRSRELFHKKRPIRRQRRTEEDSSLVEKYGSTLAKKIEAYGLNEDNERAWAVGLEPSWYADRATLKKWNDLSSTAYSDPKRPYMGTCLDGA